MRFYLDIPILLPGNVEKQYDLILPDGTPENIPLLIWIHGGGWCGGEKRIYNEWERFTHRGYGVLSIAYRFTQEAPFPAQLTDCKLAVRWARANAEKYGYNAEKILVGGGSAGGHLAALLALTNDDPRYDVGEYLSFSSRVQGVLDAYGPTDLHLSQFHANMEADLLALHGNDPRVILEASPLFRIGQSVPPFLILHGTADSVVPPCHSRRFHEALRNVNADVTFLEIPGGDHGFDSPEAYAAITAFVEKNLPVKERTP